jgi:uncharacterized protein (DUF488 family)
MTTRLYTIGYGGSTPELVVRALQEEGVQLLLDVRSRASCRWQPGFQGEALKGLVEKGGIEYQHWPTLGGEQPRWSQGEAERCVDAIKGVGLPQRIVKPGSSPIEYIAVDWSQRTVCLLCAERDPNRCHRTLLARTMAHQLGWSVMAMFPELAPRKPRKPKQEAQLSLF